MNPEPDHVAFYQGMQLGPNTVAHGVMILPDGFWEEYVNHPLSRWEAAHKIPFVPARIERRYRRSEFRKRHPILGCVFPRFGYES